LAPASNVAASGEQPPNNSGPATEDCAARSSHSAGSQPHAMPYAPTSAVQRTDSGALASQQRGSIPQIPINRGEHDAEMKGSHNNLHGHPAMQQTMNGFNAVPGAKPSLLITLVCTMFQFPLLILFNADKPLTLICPFQDQ
jgi:bromodomain-containing protein 7/9